MVQPFTEIPIDPVRAEALVNFKQVEADIFSTEPDQESALKEYQNEVNTRSLLHGPAAHSQAPIDDVILPAGTLIERGCVVQRLKQDFSVKVHAIDYGSASTQLLPDGSVIYFPSILILKK